MSRQHSQPNQQQNEYTTFQVRFQFWPFLIKTTLAWVLLVSGLVYLFSGCAEHELHGEASFYADKYHGRLAASEIVFSQFEMYAAHKTLPFGTVVRVYHSTTNDSCDVMIVDRGPFVPGRVIDLSLRAARKIKMLDAGIIPVRLKVLRVDPLPEE